MRMLPPTPKNFLSTSIVLVILALCYWNPFHVHIWEPAEKALDDFDYTDLVFAKKDMRHVPPDGNVYIINIGDANAASIDSALDYAARLHPRVIGLDVEFTGKKDTAGYARLGQTIATMPNLVLAHRYTGNIDSSGDHFLGCASHIGFDNLDAMPNKVVRYFSPFAKSKGIYDTCFAASIVHLFAPDRFDYLVKTYGMTTRLPINYTKDTSRYFKTDYRNLFKDNSETPDLTGHIVLIGYYNADSNDITHKHVTPCNQVIFGKSTPDMNGLVINANIISMMLDKNYIDPTPGWIDPFLALVTVFLFLTFYVAPRVDEPMFEHVMVKLFGTIIIVCMVVFVLLMFDKFHRKVNLGISMWILPLSVELFYIVDDIIEKIEHKKSKKEPAPAPVPASRPLLVKHVRRRRQIYRHGGRLGMSSQWRRTRQKNQRLRT
jgi:CHASE2 domain-containing sensor protein